MESFSTLSKRVEGDPRLPSPAAIQQWTDGQVDSIEWLATDNGRQFLVVIDPGHGGKDGRHWHFRDSGIGYRDADLFKDSGGLEQTPIFRL